MGVLIRGMQMPKERESFTLTIKYNGVVFDTETGIPVAAAQTVPPHGRLIDADAFIKEECNSCDGACESIPCDCLNCTADCRCDFMKDIADAPTIIPASEEGE